jgi:hypothetical protein
MNVRDFLKLVWPAQGFYCVAVPTVNAQGKKGYRHAIHDTMDDAYIDSRVRYHTKDVYFGIFTHLQAAVFNQTYGRALPTRKRENMASAKTLFLDLDVGKSEPAKPKYPTQGDALSALARFLFRTGLPSPIVVSSGYGYHVYWPLEDALPADDWRPYAQRLRLLLDHHKVIYDPARTLDISSVLRMPGTLNHKNPDDLRPVRIVHDGDATPNKLLLDLLTKLTAGLQPLSVNAPNPSNFANIVPGVTGFAPTDINEVAKECEQVRIFRDNKGNVPEPFWYVMLGLLGFCKDGETIIHQWSAGHPSYTYAETQEKSDQWKRNGSVASCAKIAADGAQGVCQRCPHFQGVHKNPIVVVNKRPLATAFMAQQAHSTPIVLPPVCDPPKPYNRLTGVGVNRDDPKGGPPITILFELDLYPISVSSGVVSGSTINHGVSTWVAREFTANGTIVHTIFEVTNNLLSDGKVMGERFASQGLFVPVTADVVKYMSAYLKELKKHTGMRPQQAHIGWPRKNDISQFALNGKVIDALGKSSPCIMAPQTQIATDGMTQGGTLQGQIEALKFYDYPGYEAHQFFILSAIGSVLFMATGHHGVVVNASGESAAGKSTALKAAAGFWGDPAKFIVNGTKGGISYHARDARAAALPNLPTMVDEITLMDPIDARNMVMSETQGRLRDTLKPDRTPREGKMPGHRASLMMTTANASLHQIVNFKSDVAGNANSARIFEIIFTKAMQHHTKSEADAAGREFDQHYGWLGEDFLKLAMPTMEHLFTSVERLMRRLDAELKTRPVERFFVAAAAPVLVVGEFMAHHGLIQWDMRRVYRWLTQTQFPAMRRQLRGLEAEIAYENVLREFIAQHALDSISNDGSGNIPPAHLRSQLVIERRPDLKELWIRRSVFTNWCKARGTPADAALDALYVNGVLKDIDSRRYLGEGTSYAIGRSRVIVVDAAHPEIDIK